MYWIMMSERSDEYELSLDGLPVVIENMDLNFDYGNFITEKLPMIDIHYVQHPEERKTDNLVAPTRLGLLINEKVKSIFDSLNIRNIQYFAAQLFDSNSNDVDKGYCIANIVGKYSCVNIDESELEFFDDGDIEFIDKLVLNIDEGSDCGHIFRMAEFPAILVISDELKNKVDEIGVSGLKIYKPEEFSL